MPRSRDGESASAASAATTGVSSPTSCRSTSMPLELAGPGDGQPARSRLDRRRPSRRGCRAARRRPAWCAAASPAPRTLPPETSGGGEERRGVGQVRLDLDVERADSAGLDPPGVRLGVVDHDAASRSVSTVICDVRLARDRLAVVVHGHALVEAGAGEQQRGDELRATPRRRGSPAPPRERSREPTHGERQPTAAAVLDLRRRGRAGRRAPGAIGRFRAWASPSNATRPSASVGDRRQEPHDRAGQPAVDRAVAAQGGRA